MSILSRANEPALYDRTEAERRARGWRSGHGDEGACVPLSAVEVKPGEPTGQLVIGIDPGPRHSECCLYRPDAETVETTHLENAELLKWARWPRFGSLAVEMIHNPGQPAGLEVYETCVYIGRLQEAWEENGGGAVRLIKRSTIRTHLIGRAAGNDAQIRSALIDRFGGETRAIGGKRCLICKGKGVVRKAPCVACDGSGYEYAPGPLRTVKGHGWQALAVAICAAELD